MNKVIKELYKNYDNLCTPSKFYFIISIISVLAMLYQNVSNQQHYIVGGYSVKLNHNNYVLFILKLLYILIWTFALNQLCRYGWSSLSWILVFLPLILMFIFIAVIILANM